jgi:hypothetical protein
LVELKNNDSYGIGYTNVRLFTLPIYGVYDDYGRIEEIEENENTQLIEKIFNCKIQDFVNALTDGRDGPEIPILKNFDNVTYCWVNRDVWDYMCSVKDEDGSFAHLGTHKLLLKLGFNYLGTDSTVERYNHKYELGGAIIHSDGNFIKDQCFSPSELKKRVPDVDLTFFDNNDVFDLWPFYNPATVIRKYHSLMGISEYIGVFSETTDEDDHGTLSELYSNQYGHEYKKLDKVQRAYYDQRKNPAIMTEFANVARIVKNAYSFSNYFKPYVLFVTPQCGEHETHQLFLDKFSEINRNIINEKNYEQNFYDENVYC